MVKMPFNQQGVADKVAELYRLTDSELAAQAGLIRQSASSWLKNNFSFTQGQLDYLSAMDPVYLSYIASNLATATENRLPVSLRQQTPPLHPIIAKWLTMVVMLDLKYIQPGKYAAGGELRFLINYA